jgi:hypothetical protein
MKTGADATEQLSVEWQQQLRETLRQVSGMNFTELEQMVGQQRQKMGLDVLRLLLAEHPLADADGCTRCPHCGGKFRILEPNQKRGVLTRLGELEYGRPYGVCDRCRYWGAPLDEAVGLPRQGPSVGALELICHAAVLGRSFEDAQEILAVHDHIGLSAKHVRELAEREGRRLVEEQAAAVRRYQGRQPIRSAASPSLLVVAVDGGRVQTRQISDRWKEDKVGVVYDADPQPATTAAAVGEYEGAHAKTKTYVATMEPWEALGWMVRVEAEQRGYARARQKLVVADGARTIRELQQLQFPEATFILDWAHACGHLSESAKAAWGENQAKVEAGYERWRGWLWDGEVEKVIGQLEESSRRVGKPGPNESSESPRVILDRDARVYFPNNREAVRYPEFRRKGWPIGSGVVEGAIKQFGMRLKGSEKFWNVCQLGAEEMLALCALYQSEDGRWGRHWEWRAATCREK